MELKTSPSPTVNASSRASAASGESLKCKLKGGQWVVRTRHRAFLLGCRSTGDHSYLSGPSLVVKPSPDPLRSDPVAHVVRLCRLRPLRPRWWAAVLCPSFYTTLCRTGLAMFKPR